jgi:hypothetical protein
MKGAIDACKHVIDFEKVSVEVIGPALLAGSGTTCATYPHARHWATSP